MVNIYVGRQGRLWDTVVERVALGRRTCGHVLVLVPPHYTLQTERDLMHSLHEKGFFDVDVQSTARLARRVLAQSGGDDKGQVDVGGKMMAMVGALGRVKGALTYYERAAHKPGFIKHLCDMVATFKRAGVLGEQLLSYAQGMEDGAQKDKLQDLARIYIAYEEMLFSRFMDAEDVQRLLFERAPEAAFIKGAHIVIYGFDLITQELARLVLAFCPAGAKVDVVLCLDNEDEAFSPVGKSLARFEKLLEDNHLLWEETAIKGALDAPLDIAALEQGLLNPGAPPYLGAVGAVRLYVAPTPFAEAHFVAREILLNHYAGIAYEDMAVFVLDEGRYFSTFSTVLGSYLIPHDIKQKASAQNAGAALFVLCALEAAASGYRAQEMCALLRTGYTGLSDEETFLMENYITAYGIRGKLFTAPFARGGERGIALEDARKRLITPLESLRTGLRAAQNTDDTLKAIVQFLEDTNAYQVHQKMVAALENAGFGARAMQLNQVWMALMKIMDQMHELLGGVKLSGAQAAGWLEAALSQTRLSALPETAGSVGVGLVGNVVNRRYKVVFLVGLNDGALSASDEGILLDAEQAALEDAFDVSLSMDMDGRDQLRRLDLVKAIACAGEKLYLTGAQALVDGTALRPLSQVHAVKRLLPALIEEGGVTAPQGASLPLALTPALDAMAAHLKQGQMDENWQGAWRFIWKNAPDKAQALLDAFQKRDVLAPLDREVAQRLFLERVSSVSRLETFAACPFKHFVRYGLKPVENKTWTLGRSDVGTFYHDAMEGFTRVLPTLPGWPNIDKKTCDAAMNGAAQGAMSDVMRQMLSDSARMRKKAEHYQRLLRRVAWTFTKTARDCAFRPDKAEVSFGYEGGLPPLQLTLQDGAQVLLRGRIDRIDRYEGDEGVFLRVVDYKSGASELKPAEIFYGVQLQLLIYLMAALQMEEGALPAGAFYFHLYDPLCQDEGDKAKVELALAKKLALKGVTLKDAQVIRLLDSGQPPLSMPKLLNNDGTFAARGQLASFEEMRGLMEHALTCAKELAQEALRGSLAPAPLSIEGGLNACERCDYAAICRKSAPESPTLERMGDKLSFDDLLQKVTMPGKSG